MQRCILKVQQTASCDRGHLLLAAWQACAARVEAGLPTVVAGSPMKAASVQSLKQDPGRTRPARPAGMYTQFYATCMCKMGTMQTDTARCEGQSGQLSL